MAADEADVRLHDRLVAGDEDALAQVYDRWSTLVYSLAARITNDHAGAEDITQDVFVCLWERPDRYDPHRGALRTWLCLLARSRAIDWLRRAAARERVHVATAARPGTEAEVDEALIWETEAKVVREAIHALPDPQRDAVVLAYRHGRSYRQVALELDIPEGTAKSRLRGALATLADRLESEGILER